MSELNKLYTPFIKSQNETPFHFSKNPSAQFVLRAYNPICGDRFDIYVDPVGAPDNIHFHGFGCAISKASTSVMVKLLTGKSYQDSLSIVNEFLDYIDKRITESQLTLGEELKAFSMVHEFPGRYDCATLSWKAMKKFLEDKELEK